MCRKIKRKLLKITGLHARTYTKNLHRSKFLFHVCCKLYLLIYEHLIDKNYKWRLAGSFFSGSTVFWVTNQLDDCETNQVGDNQLGDRLWFSGRHQLDQLGQGSEVRYTSSVDQLVTIMLFIIYIFNKQSFEMHSKLNSHRSDVM